MEDAKNFVLGIFQTVKERFGNPLVSAFAVAWAIWNFRLLLVLIGTGDGGWKAKITYIDTVLMPEWWHWGVHGLGIPLVSALIWIYGLPPVLRAVAAFHERTQNETRKAIFEATEARTLSSDEALSMRQVMIKQRAEWLSEKAEVLQSLENLVKKLDEANATVHANLKRDQERTNEIEALKSEIARLQAPPKPTPFDFSGKPTKEKAAALGLQLLGREPAAPSTISFDGFPVSWPWNPPENRLLNIPHKSLIKHPLDEETIWGMYYLVKHYPGGSNRRTVAEWASSFRESGAKRPDALINLLLLHGVLSGSYEAPEFSAHQVAAVLWLKSIGFKETSP